MADLAQQALLETMKVTLVELTAMRKDLDATIGRVLRLQSEIQHCIDTVENPLDLPDKEVR